MSDKKSFVLYHDLRAPLGLLTDEERGRLFSAIFDYSEFGETPDFTGALQMAFAFVRTALDRDAEMWESKQEKRREAGSKGGKQTAANRANAVSDEQTAEKEPISFIGLEKKCFMRFPIEINGKKTEIKLKGVIDRIDKLADELRIIDYKTGSNDVVCNSVDDVFDALQIKRNKGILQTLIYCMMFDSEDPTHQTMMPYLFKTVDLSKNADFKVHSKNDEFSEGSYRRVEPKVKDFVTGVLSDIFDKEKPFVQTADEKKCEHCNFFYFCNKQSKSNDY